MKSTIERLAASATQDNIDSYIAGMTQFRQDLLQAHAEYAELERRNAELKRLLLVAHRKSCTPSNCMLRGEPEHAEAFAHNTQGE